MGLVAAALAGGCFAPEYGSGHLSCQEARACPEGFYCATDNRCWRKGDEPREADAGVDAAEDMAAPVEAGVGEDRGREASAPEAMPAADAGDAREPADIASDRPVDADPNALVTDFDITPGPLPFSSGRSFYELNLPISARTV